MLYAQIEVDVSEYTNSSLTISAFTDTPSTFGNIFISASTQGYMGNVYSETGERVYYPQYNSSVSFLEIT